ncbi:hypothetical protein RhiJN_18434 [Ceratobasidium sp. AG-Ba]|nr:hypothetical protein RhiJN_18434 [Ceratobasidium sp. AG-Ba]
MDSPNPASVSHIGTSSHLANNKSQSTIREGVSLSIQADLQRSETCDFDTLLGVLLSCCVSEIVPAPNVSSVLTVDLSTRHIPKTGFKAPPEDSPDSDETMKPDTNELLDKIIDAVLFLCNDTSFRQKIQKFCDAPSIGNTGCAPFVEACNYALQELKPLVVPGLRSPSSDILFHVNDPKIIYGYNHSRRVPGVAIVSLNTVKRVRGDPQTTWLEAIDERCHKSPGSELRWPEIMSFVEFKRLNSIKSEFPQKYHKAAYACYPAKDMSNISKFSNTPSSTPTSIYACSSTRSRSSHSGGDVHQKMDIEEPLEPVSQASIAQTGVSSVKDRVSDRIVFETLNNRPNSLSPKLDKKTARDLAQCGEYAAEMLNSVVGRLHVVGMYLVDQVLWVWWYDRQGAIQTTGIDIVQDLPRFAALLLAFQRFRRADWGYGPTFDPEVISQDGPKEKSASTVRKIHFEGLDVIINLDDIIHETYCLSGRSTTVLGASDANPANASPHLILKCSWAHKSRPTEKAIIEKAIKVAPRAKSHLPKVFASRDLGDTKSIRIQLGTHKTSRRPFRVFRMAVYERLIPITTLSGAVRMMVLLDCIKCHYLLWKGGVHHRDLSLSNLMVRVIDGVYYGILNDFDLSHIAELGLEINEHTATLPFLARELLCDEYWEGKLEVKYKHDWESFIWIAYWLGRSSEFLNGEVPQDLHRWKTGVLECCSMKDHVLRTPGYTKRPIDTLEWRTAAQLLHYLEWLTVQKRFYEMAPDTPGRPSIAEPSEAELLEEMLKRVVKTLPEAYQGLLNTATDEFFDHVVRLSFLQVE